MDGGIPLSAASLLHWHYSISMKGLTIKRWECYTHDNILEGAAFQIPCPAACSGVIDVSGIAYAVSDFFTIVRVFPACL